MFEALYEEFGEETVHLVRRELTAKNGKMPGYIELLAELYLREGPNTGSSTTGVIVCTSKQEEDITCQACHRQIKTEITPDGGWIRECLDCGTKLTFIPKKEG